MQLSLPGVLFSSPSGSLKADWASPLKWAWGGVFCGCFFFFLYLCFISASFDNKAFTEGGQDVPSSLKGLRDHEPRPFNVPEKGLVCLPVPSTVPGVNPLELPPHSRLGPRCC